MRKERKFCGLKEHESSRILNSMMGKTSAFIHRHVTRLHSDGLTKINYNLVVS